MVIDDWEAEQNAAFDEFVESLSKELYAEHAEQAIDEFIKARLRSFYAENTTVAVDATIFLRKAKELISTDPTASLFYSSVATEVFIKSVILKPIIAGLVHSGATAELVTGLMVNQSGMDRFSDLLFTISYEYAGIDLKILKRRGSHKPLWQERAEVQRIRNRIAHQAKECSEVDAKLSFEIALHIFWVAKELVEGLGFGFDEEKNIVSIS